MNADDDGFVNNWKSIMRMTGHKEDDLKVLTAKQFIIPFDSGVIVIKHWRINNYLRNDRYVETKFKDEKSKLMLDDNLVYQMDTNGVHSIDKNSIDKNRLEYKSFKKPTLEEVAAYCNERNNGVNPENFIDFYESKGWMVGKNKMQNWKACVRTWEKKEKQESKVPEWFDKKFEVEEVDEKEFDDLLNI